MKSEIILRPDELAFIKSQRLASSDVFDCRGQSIASCRDQAEADGKDFFLVQPRNCGHRLVTRASHCIQCDTSRIAYQSRWRKSGHVYVMHSASQQLVKIGFSENIDRREHQINSEKLAGTSDWKLVFHIKTDKAGELEKHVQSKMNDSSVSSNREKEGRSQTSRECFSCWPRDAVKAVLDCAKNGNHTIAMIFDPKGLQNLT